MNKLRRIIKLEYLLIIVLLEISAFAHSYNMFKFPYYENDEGTYMSQAWSVVEKQELAPYTYWYDHAPAGWFLISLWTQLSGGFFTFGFSVNSGRVLMMILQVVSTFFVYRITKKLSGSVLASTIAALLFSLSPLAIYFHRRVLLDNIMVFWLLASINLIIAKKLTLTKVVFSAVLFAIAILSKETAIVFFPGFLILLFNRLNKSNRLFVMLEWLAICVMVVSTYILYALLKGEFFPEGSLLGGDSSHVSLLGSLLFQMSRKSSGGAFFDLNAQIWHELSNWYSQDRLMIISGLSSFVIGIVLSIKKRVYLSYVVMLLGYLWFLGRGGVLIEFYILPAIPFFVILTGSVINELIIFVNKKMSLSSFSISNIKLQAFVSLILVGGIGYYYLNFGYINRGNNIYTSNQTKAQIEAISWIRENISSDSIFIVDNYGYIDLKATDNPSARSFKNAEWYWKIDTDREIKTGKLKDNPNNIDIIALTPQTTHDLKFGNFTFLSKALANSTSIQNFWSDGWGVEFRATKLPKEVLKSSWVNYRQVYISDDGRIDNPKKPGETTSEVMGLSMFRAVWIDDLEEFSKIWLWTKNNMSNGKGLFGWRWSESGGLVDKGTVSSSDTDIAVSLVLASKRWERTEYLTDARKIIESIWTNEVKIINGKPYMVAGDWMVKKDGATVSMGGISPYAYKIFAAVDPKHDWEKLADSSYELLNNCSNDSLEFSKSVGLPPDWCIVNATGEIKPLIDSNLGSSKYGYSGSQALWRVGLDYLWNRDTRAFSYLNSREFIKNEWNKNGKLAAVYSHDGKVVEGWESVVKYSGDLSVFVFADLNIAKEMYSQKISAKYMQN
ncbi:MAG: glycosyl hydrolase family 8, partial [bacterium]|nr:glycosyl hydrolase family 8 [bacterium]